MLWRPKLLIAALLLASSATMFSSSLWWSAASGNATNKAAKPTFLPTGFTSTCHGTQTVTISTSTFGAKIRYTTDGSDPTCAVGTLINATSGTVNIGAHTDTVLNAVAFTNCVSPDTSDEAETEYDFSCG